MRIVHYLAQLYCVLLAVSETSIYFSQRPQNDLEKITQEIKGAIAPDTITNLPLILSTISIGLFLAWLYAMGKKKEGLKTGLLGLTFVLSIFVLWTESVWY